MIFGPVDDINEVPTPESLESLEIHLADDTAANRRALAERLPGCRILFQEEDRPAAFDPTANWPG
ncbi:MAG: hypothetical protein LBG60_13515 [Bifidobacteriaceae bacterium]|jgi:hypothetical protein|nr:hypothetical protein [Bifidobacteriaceae bacterium]